MADEYVLDEEGNPKLDADGNKIPVEKKKPAKTPLPEGVDAELMQKLIQEGIDEALGPIKDNLDSAYAERDAEKARVAEFEQKERDLEIQRLKDIGEHQKAHDIEIKALQDERDALKATNIGLTRDTEVQKALGKYTFRSDKAADMAFKEISANLIQDENGTWVSKDGVAIGEHVNSFVTSEDNSFLLKQKPNTGTGSTASTTTPPASDEGKSLFDRPQAEVLQMAAERKLPTQQE